jgi:hypothetical protein
VTSSICNPAPNASAGLTRSSRRRSSHERARSAARSRGRPNPPRQRPQRLHRADRGTLSVSMELGQLPRGAGLGAARRGSRVPGDRDAVHRSVAGRDGATHRVPQARSRLLPRAGTVGYAPHADDLRHHAAARRGLLRAAHPGGCS